MDVEVTALVQDNTTQQEIAVLVEQAQEALLQVQVQDVMSIQAFRPPEKTNSEKGKEVKEIGLFILTVNLPNPYALSSGLQELAVVLINSDRITQVRMRYGGALLYQFNPTKYMVKEVIFKAVDALIMSYRDGGPALEGTDREG